MSQASPDRFAACGRDGLHLDVGFENSNPLSADFVGNEEDGTYVIRQFLEAGAPAGYSFHLNVAFVNEGNVARRVAVRIQWAEKEFDCCHDYMYIGYDSGARWQMLSTPCRDGVTEMALVVPPGRHLLCCSPKFDCADYAALLRRFEKHPALERMDVAQTPGGRSISCLRCGTRGMRKAVLLTRAHAYETAGAYCIDGWLTDMVRAPDRYAGVLSRVELYVFPMINPDGVAAGHCCLAPSGVNFGNELITRAEDDTGALGFRDFVLGLKPDFLVDMHNYTGKHQHDAFRCSSQELLDAFAAVAPDSSYHQKVWSPLNKVYPQDYLIGSCAERFGTLGVLTEFPWYTRLPRDMREHGRSFLSVLLSLFAA